MALKSYLLKNSQFIRIQSSELKAFPFFTLPCLPRNEFIYIDPLKSLKDLKDELYEKTNKQEVSFLGIDGSKLGLGNSLQESTIDPLYIKIGDDKMYTLYNLNIHQIHLTPHQRALAQQYEKSKNLTREEAETIGTFNYYILKELNEYPDQNISSETFSLMVKNAILQYGSQLLHQRQLFESQLALFKSQHAFELDVHEEAKKKADFHARKMIKRFYYIIFTQFLGIQYGTYHLYSWDIMEPITCMMAMGDVSFGYLFWMLGGQRDYGMDGIKGFFYDRNYKRLLRKKGVNIEDMKNILKTIEEIEKRLEIS